MMEQKEHYHCSRNLAKQRRTVGRHIAYGAVLPLSLVGSLAMAEINYLTVDVDAAIGHGGNFLDGYIRGNATDTVLSALGIPDEFANPLGSLSYTYSYNLPFAQLDVASYLSATSTWDAFVVSGSFVEVRDFDMHGTEVATNGAYWEVSLASGGSQYIRTTFDGRMEASFTTNKTYAGPFAPWIGGTLANEITAFGGYILNDAATGLQSASALQFAPLGAGFDQTAADYLNFVAATHLPENWTQAGMWVFQDDMTEDNTSGDFAESVIGGSFLGYNVWFSTDTFVFGKPVGDPDSSGIISLEAIDDLISDGLFPEVADLQLIGLRLAGDGFAQLYDIAVVSGDGTEQTIVFEYDGSLISAAQEPLLAIAHYVDGTWELPFQILDIDANSITVTLNSFSPFALVAPVPLPAALPLLGSALAGLFAACGRRSVRRRCA